MYYHRLYDPAQSFSNTTKLRFSLHNPYDCFIYVYPIFIALELKSTLGSSISFYKNGDDSKSVKMIKQNQIDGLRSASNTYGCIAGFLCNFRKTGNTYFWDIKNFDRFVESSKKRSFNEKDLLLNNGILIKNKKLKVNYRYDVIDFIDKIKNRFDKGEF